MKTILKQNWKKILIWTLILAAILVSLKLGIDKKIVVFATLTLGLFTQIFAGLGATVSLVPLVGPLVVKVLTIPFFWLLNALGYFVSIIVIKKGYTREYLGTRAMTFILLIGIVFGYVLGHLIPLR